MSLTGAAVPPKDSGGPLEAGKKLTVELTVGVSQQDDEGLRGRDSCCQRRASGGSGRE